MNASTKRDQLRQQYINNQDKRVLLVEGSNDVAAFQLLLSRFGVLGWEKRWVVASAGNKKQVVEILNLEPDWLGVVDRDEWDAVELNKRRLAQSNLMVLARFCMENYLVVPSELWLAIPPHQQARVPGGEAAFQTALLTPLSNYVRHGVLWQVVAPLWTGLRALGFKEALAADTPASVATAQNDPEIQQVLADWDNFLDPFVIFNRFQQGLAIAQALPPEEQLKHHVHGKTYWAQVVSPNMTIWFGPSKDTTRRQNIFSQWATLPSDMQALLARVI